jgi:hypothetical protein
MTTQVSFNTHKLQSVQAVKFPANCARHGELRKP